jgi:hypothetical protein
MVTEATELKRREAFMQLLSLSLLAPVTAFAAKLMAVPLVGRNVDHARYAADRTEIEELESRYIFALDWQDADAYAATFTQDGVLDWAQGIVTGREAIKAEVKGMRATFAKRESGDAPLRPARLRHFITNRVLSIEGDRARSVAYWFEFSNDNRNRWPMASGYGHYEDELQRIAGQWLFSRRKIFNEIMDSRAAGPENPVARLGL